MLQRYRGIARVLGLVMSSLIFMALLEIDVVGQDEFPSPHVFLVKMSNCTNEPKNRTQTGFRIQGVTGIVTALHGVVDCETIQATNPEEPTYNDLKITQVDVKRDVAVLATTNRNMGSTGFRKLEPLRGTSDRDESDWVEPQLIGYPAGLQLQLVTRNISIRNMQPSGGGWLRVILSALVPPDDKRNMLAKRGSPDLGVPIISVEGVMTHGHSGAPLLSKSWEVLAVANGGLAGGAWEISWAIPWSEVELVDVGDSEVKKHLKELRDLNPRESGLLDSYSSIDPRDAIGENTFSGASRVHTPKGVVGLTVRTGPGFPYARQSFQLSDGQPVTIIDRNESKTWLKVRTSSDDEGWILAIYIRPDLDSGETTQSTKAQCPVKADSQLDQYWNYDALGCAFGPSRTIWAAWQTFEGGIALWRNDTKKIYGFFSDGSWVEVDDWDQVSEINIEGTPPSGLHKPVRGFAYVWSTNPRFSRSLGWATDEKEEGFCAVIQDFEGGFILRSSQIESCHINEEGNPDENNARKENFRLKYVVANWTGTWFRQ